jgi:FAD-dependent oxidoreductase domain-containing protein 1
MARQSFDYLIIGAGILGSAAAYSLSKRLKDKGREVSIGVLDPDLEGEHSSTLKNAGGVRATWRNRANIGLSKYSLDFYATIAREIQFRRLGYYWMHNERSWEEMNENLPLYKEYELGVELYTPRDITKLMPFVDNLDGVSGLSISRKAGLIDHYSLRQLYRNGARERGVRFFDRHYVDEVSLEGGSVSRVSAIDLASTGQDAANLGDTVMRTLISGDAGEVSGKIEFKCTTLINTAGAWAPRVSALYGFNDDQVKPRKRQMVIMKSPDVDLSSYGMVIDTSDVYFHKESENILAGYSNMDEPYGYNFDFTFGGMDEKSQFVKHIWLPLSRRISRFERLKQIRGWAGIYAETPDRSGYLGKVPGLDNVFECAAHTGRGLMISYGAGEALTDLILEGEFRKELMHTRDLSRERPSGEQYEGLHL